MSNSTAKLDEKAKQMLQQIKKFGFEFQGLGENGYPLVKAVSGQIVPLSVAVEFVNKKIQEQRDSQAGGSVEQMPASTEGIVESTSETAIETAMESQLEEAKEVEDTRDETSKDQSDLQVPQKAPQIQLKDSKLKPFGFGFTPKSFNPADIKQAEKYIQQNSRKKNMSSNKWLAIQFKKFVEEMKQGKIEMNGG